MHVTFSFRVIDNPDSRSMEPRDSSRFSDVAIPKGERPRRFAHCEAPRVDQRDQMSLCSPLSPWTRVA